MAGITQTIPSYVAGISEQPDQLKSPGQVSSIVNAIPDVTFGLYKRPGAKRVESAAGGGALTNVSSADGGGSWFHYYRDETEGSYIGQIASNGRLRMWSCNDGSEKNVWYHTDNSAFDGSNSNHTSITSYLTPSPATDNEDIQALTINDTTFLNNRSKITATTGTTDARPDAHFAYLEILRTENGRQYGFNLYNDTSTTTIKRATRVKIASDSLAEGAGTGTCPGIGTQVFSGAETNTGSRKNLTFRITTMGQQGRASGTSESITGNSYECSYNREVSLLHGGEDWEDGDTTTVTLDSAKTSYTYTVEVTEHEASVIQANIKAVRPAPTPFDADTAVTAETVIGGIQSELSGITVGGQSLTATVIGNGIYLACANAFNIDVMENDLMRVMQGTVNDVTKLPIQCKHGYIVKVANTRMSDEDDYFTKFHGANNKDGSGVWIECPEPGIVKSFDPTTMPHVLQRQADGDFLVKHYGWKDRLVGDDVTNPLPSFVGKGINKVVFFRNRLVFLAGENVITSKPGSIDVPDFFNNSALTLGAIDPIDIACSSLYPSDLYDAIELPAGLLCFSTNQQFLLSADDTVFNPDTAKLRAVSNHNYNKVLPPIKTTYTVGFIDNSFKYSRFMELGGIKREDMATIVETSKLVPTMLEKDVDLITSSRENNMVFIGKTDSDTVFGYRYFRTSSTDEALQSAWFKWKHNNPIKYHFCVEDVYYFLDTDNFLQSINLVQADADPNIDQDSINYLIHLDNYTTVLGGVYNGTTNATTFTDGTGSCEFTWQSSITSPNGKLVLVDTNSTATRVGRYAEVTVTNAGTTFTVPGDWSGVTVHIGYLYEYSVKFPTLYPVQPTGPKQFRSDVNSKLTVHRIKLNFGKIGLYETTLERVGKAPYTEIYESTDLDEYNVSDAPFLNEKIKDIPVYERNTNVDITLKSSHPAPATLISMSWEGDWSPMHYRKS